MNDFTLIWSVFRRHKVRTIFTVFSVATAFTIFTILAAMHHGLTGQIRLSLAQRLLTYNKLANGDTLPVGYAAKIASVPGISAVGYISWFGGYFRDPKNTVEIQAFSSNSVLRVYPELALSPAQTNAFLRDQQGVIVGPVLAQQMGWMIGDTVPLQGGPLQKNGSTTWYFHIVGIYHADLPAGYQNMFIAHYRYFNDGIANERARDTVNQFEVLVANIQDIDRVARVINSQFEDASPQTRTRSEQEVVRSGLRQFGDIGAMLTYVGVAVFFSMLLITGNTMANSVRERVSEFAIMRALGFGPWQLTRIILQESGCVTLTGAAFGMLLGLEICHLLAPSITQVLEAFDVTWSAVALGLGLAIVFAAFTGIVPSQRIRRLAVAAALRSP